MVSFFKLIFNIFQKGEIIIVSRLPAVKSLRAHLMGLTFGLVFVGLSVALNQPLSSWAVSSGVLIWFAMVALYRRLWFLASIVLFMALSFASPSVGSFWSVVKISSQWFFIGYLFGAVLATFYNDLVYLFLKIFERHRLKIAFAIDPQKTINIIKSPREEEEVALLGVIKPLKYYVEAVRRGDNTARNATEIVDLIKKAFKQMSILDREKLEALVNGHATGNLAANLDQLKKDLSATMDSKLNLIAREIEPLVEKYLKLKQKKLYNYKIDDPPDQPYTIAFVANPTIWKRENQTEKKTEPDPIIKDLDLFLQSVNHALASFETDPVLGRPEVWSQIRIVTIFSDSRRGEAFSMLQEFQEEAYASGGHRIGNKIIDPRPQMKSNLENLFKEIPLPDKPVQVDDLDVIYGLTASNSHDRASAYNSDWMRVKEISEIPTNPKNRPGICFEFNMDPLDNKRDYDYCHERNKRDDCCDGGLRETVIKEPSFDDDSKFNKLHDFYATIPGRVALNVLSASRYSYLHEFGHAMCSAFHGTIADEYMDYLIVTGAKTIPFTWFNVNRIERDVASGKSIPVHKEFAQYNGSHYYSDLDHPSAEENWSGYFPDRIAPHITCVMDSSSRNSRFDHLLSKFIYDRLLAKFCRPKRPHVTLDEVWDGIDENTDRIAKLHLQFFSFRSGQRIRNSKAIHKLLEKEIQPIAEIEFDTKRIRVEVIRLTPGSLQAVMDLTTIGSKVSNEFKEADPFKRQAAAFEHHVKAVAGYLECKIAESPVPSSGVSIQIGRPGQSE